MAVSKTGTAIDLGPLTLDTEPAAEEANARAPKNPCPSLIDSAIRDLLRRRETARAHRDRAGAYPREALVVNRQASWFRPPSGSPVDIRTRRPTRRILHALTEHRLNSPGTPLPADRVIAAGWPGEALLRHSARNRLWVAISELRKLGLGSVLVTTRGGYMLLPEVAVVVLDE
jgi:hypothetical protein